jgi:hypothetical protein
VIDALKAKDLLLKTELEDSHKSSIDRLSDMTDENIEFLKGEEQE